MKNGTASGSAINRAYYYADCDEFLNASEEAILGELTDSHMPLALTVQQEQAWKEEIRILKQVDRKSVV